MILDKKLFEKCCCGLLLLLLSSCSGGDGGGGDQTPISGAIKLTATTLDGRVADGYLRNARVFLDRNGNRLYDNGEPTTYSAAAGAFSLEVSPGEGELFPLVVDVLAGQTVDEDTGVAVEKDYRLEAPKGHWQFISPLTTMLKRTQDKNPSMTELEAVLKVRSELGLDDTVSLYADYLAKSPGGAETIDDQSAREYQLAHKAAQVVAAVLGDLQADIEQNLGGIVADTEQAAVAFMISDKIEEQAATIKQALDDARNLAQEVDVTTVVMAVRAEIDTATLDAEQLAVYEQRIAQDLPYWDMQPPDLVGKTPPEDDTTSVVMTIGIVFNEPIDETRISDSSVQLLGPVGQVPGVVDYDAGQQKLTFTPDQVLLPNSEYRVTLESGVADMLGNEHTEDISWNFSTVFDQVPPPLPDF